MVIVKKSIIIAFLILISCNMFGKSNGGENNCKIEIKIEKLNTSFHLKDSKHVFILITNKNSQPMLFPEYLNIGEAFGQQETDLVFEIRMKDPLTKKFSILDYYMEFSRIKLSRKILTITPNRTIRIEQSLALITQLDNAGEYQIRAKIKLIDNICSCEIKSDWMNFSVVE